MNAEIIAVGSELLLGQIVNTNARFLSLHLAGMGINVYYHTVVGDNPDRLKMAIEIAEKRSDIIIFTGGLGPTKDDLTKETIAKHIGKELVMDEEALSSITQYFIKTKRMMTENNRKQAVVLKDSIVLPNDHGMAPGMLVRSNDHIYLLLPGPPKEMEPMFLHYGQSALTSLYDTDTKIVSRVLRFFGIGESALETEIEDLIDAQSNPTIAPLAADGEVTLRLTASHSNLETAQTMLDKTENEIRSRVGQYLYGYDNSSLMKELVVLLFEKKLTIAVAESLTGGLFQQELTAIPGTSALLKGGVVCYTNFVKQKVLNVKADTIDKYGAVSEQCASELAENVAALIG
ncbi:MAG TPA: competence/damage-inducible protein A, partial [Bacillales bacterium]|nr:competence/damage-inducible protein A [Bacillales bacterium]